MIRWEIINDTDEYHRDIVQELYVHGILCDFVDIYLDTNLAFISGCTCTDTEISEALGVDVECISRQGSLVIVKGV